jgi:hypothetical protein
VRRERVKRRRKMQEGGGEGNRERTGEMTLDSEEQLTTMIKA